MTDIITLLSETFAVLMNLPSPTYGLYLLSFIFAFSIALSVALHTKNHYIGLITFFGTLFIFSLLGGFPLWAIAVPIVIVLFLFSLYRFRIGGQE